MYVVLKGKAPSDVLVKELTDLVLPQFLVRKKQCISSGVFSDPIVMHAASAHLLAGTRTPKMAVQ